jgi:hypothetical protein
VEAARAGEAGLSFAVVADEVRNLANRSREAAVSTTSMLESSLGRINEGAQLVGKAKESFDKLVATSDQVTEIVASITLASKSQTRDIQDIHQSIALMDKVTQENSLEAAETVNISKALNRQAGLLNNTLRKVTAILSGAGPGPAGPGMTRTLPAPAGSGKAKAASVRESPEPREPQEALNLEDLKKEEPRSSFKSVSDKDLDKTLPMDDDF